MTAILVAFDCAGPRFCSHEMSGSRIRCNKGVSLEKYLDNSSAPAFWKTVRPTTGRSKISSGSPKPASTPKNTPNPSLERYGLARFDNWRKNSIILEYQNRRARWNIARLFDCLAFLITLE